MQNFLVPTAIQRIRAFLVENCGMKVKPWATAEETLAALHATLLARHTCQIFWTSLRALLEQLARDLKARQDAEPGSLLDNELLDSSRYETLINEIRTAMDRDPAEVSSFRRLASALSAPALGLLLLLAGTTTVACNSSTLRQDTTQQDGGKADSANPDNTIVLRLDASTAIADSGGSDARDATQENAADAFVFRDTVAPSATDGATVTIQDILQACNLTSGYQTAVLDCLATLRASWTQGVASSLAGLGCDVVEYDLTCFLRSQCTGTPTSQDFNANTAFYCPPVLIYLGVRFV